MKPDAIKDFVEGEERGRVFLLLKSRQDPVLVHITLNQRERFIYLHFLMERRQLNEKKNFLEVSLFFLIKVFPKKGSFKAILCIRCDEIQRKIDDAMFH